MKTTEELRADAKTAHAVYEAVLREKKVWQLVATLVAIGGVLIGAGLVRAGSHYARDTPLALDAARVVQLKAEVDRQRVECAPPVLQARCPADPLGGPCAVSWRRILKEPSFDVMFVKCDEGKWWRVDWTQVLGP